MLSYFEPMGSRAETFREILSGRIVDYQLFKKICYTGIPMQERLAAYRILLGVVGLDTAMAAKELAAKAARHRLYLETARLRGLPDSVPPRGIAGPAWVGSGNPVERPSAKETGGEVAYRSSLPDISLALSKNLRHQIQIDVVRISPIYKKYHGVDYTLVFTNVLAILALQRPYIGYLQGMADLVVPFLHLHCLSPASQPADLVATQSTVFYCLNSLLNRLQSGLFDLQAQLLVRLEALLERADSDLILHIRAVGLELHMVCFRWFSCIFIREFALNVWYRLFDALLCDDLEDFVVFFAAALLIWFRTRVLAGDMPSIVLLMQNLQQEDLTVEHVETLIGSANYLKGEYSSQCGQP